MKKILSVLFILWFINSNNLFAQAWTELNSGTNQFLYGVQFPSADVGFVYGDAGLYKTSNAGDLWQQSGSIVAPYPCYFSSTQTGYAITANGVEKTTDGGANWTPGYVPLDVLAWDMYFVNDNLGYVCGFMNSNSEASFMKTIDGGDNWTESSITGAMDAISLYFTGSTTGYVGTESGIFKTTDGGDNWTGHATGTNNFTAADIHFPTPSIGYACGSGDNGETIYKTTDGGENWTLLNNPFSTNPLNGIYFTSVDTGYAVGGNGINSGTLIQTVNGGTTWTISHTTSKTLNAVYFTSAHTGYAVGENGTIYKYSSSTGIGEASPTIGSIFPNPSNGVFNLVLRSYEKGIKLLVTDITGQSIMQTNINSQQTSIDLSKYATGIYIVQVSYPDGETDCKKVIKE